MGRTVGDPTDCPNPFASSSARSGIYCSGIDLTPRCSRNDALLSHSGSVMAPAIFVIAQFLLGQFVSVTQLSVCT